MTLIRCPECKKQISDIAQQCPYCGCCDFTPKPKKKISKKKLLFYLLFPVIMAMLAISVQNKPLPSYSYASTQNTLNRQQEEALPAETTDTPQEEALPDEAVSAPQEETSPEETIEAPQQNDEPTFEDMGL